MLVRYTPWATTVFTQKGFIIVIHAVGARTIVAFPARRIVVIVAGIVGHTVLAVVVAGSITMNGSGGTAVVTVIGIAATIAIVVDAVVDAVIIADTTKTYTDAGTGNNAGGITHGRGCGDCDSAAADDIGR